LEDSALTSETVVGVDLGGIGFWASIHVEKEVFSRCLKMTYFMNSGVCRMSLQDYEVQIGSACHNSGTDVAYFPTFT